MTKSRKPVDAKRDVREGNGRNTNKMEGEEY
jgi:hypothetical protein